jgi:transcriptional regulator with GAF, ATPase, and Fis domain
LIEDHGTGKELLARAIHFSSPRRDQPLITVNCSSIPENLLESELFGHVKGAFTGAVKDREGKFEQAEGGTIFLDEIGDLKPELQAKLLRVLQEKEIERVGGSQPLKVDVRIIAATNRDLTAAVREGNFREDLYYRLMVVPISLPSLREHPENIPFLVDHFLQKHGSGRPLRLAPESLEQLRHYDWPGNVRELENAVARATALDFVSQVVFRICGVLESGDAQQLSPWRRRRWPRAHRRNRDGAERRPVVDSHAARAASGRVAGRGQRRCVPRCAQSDRL